MPRKARVDPPPLADSFQMQVNDETILVEIRDETCVIKSSGYANREIYLDRLWKSIMPKVIDDYLDVNGRKNIPPSKDYLSSPTKFANRMVKYGIHFTGDTSSLRKDYYPRVIKELQVFANAIEAKKLI